MDGLISIDAGSGASLSQQIYKQIRSAILSGGLGAGQKLASTRSLAASLLVSRTAVYEAYERLASEGYIYGVHGSGSFVGSVPSREPATKALATTTTPSEPSTRRDMLSEAAHRIADLGPIRQPSGRTGTSFLYGQPNLDQFPIALWRRLVGRVLRDDTDRLLRYASDPAGLPDLREAIATHLLARRGIQCSADDIIVVQGAQQGLDLIGRLLIDPGDNVLVEDPCYRGTRAAFMAHGANMIGLPVDSEGIAIPSKADLAGRPKLLHCTPSHQFPMGYVLTAPRRMELYDLARRHQFYICEDDYDSEFRFRIKPVPALKSLDSADLVIHVGTFSKSLFPALRLGYIVVPNALREPMAALKEASDMQSPSVDQAVTALFIDEGHYARYLGRMRKVYARRRELLVSALGKHLGEMAEISGDEAGLHLAVRLHVDLTDIEVADLAAKNGVLLAPLSRYFLGRTAPHAEPHCLLGYTSVKESDIAPGIERLAKALRGVGKSRKATDR